MKYTCLLLLAHQGIVCSANDDIPKKVQKIVVTQHDDAYAKTRTRAFSLMMKQDPNVLKNIEMLVKKEGPDVATALLDNAARAKGSQTRNYINELVKNGADVLGRRRTGSLAGVQTLTPLDIAVMKGNITAVEALLRQGASTQKCFILGFEKDVSVNTVVATLIDKINNDYWKCQHGITCNKKEIQRIKKLLENQVKLLKEQEQEKKRELKELSKERRRLKPTKSQELLNFFKKK